MLACAHRFLFVTAPRVHMHLPGTPGHPLRPSVSYPKQEISMLVQDNNIWLSKIEAFGAKPTGCSIGFIGKDTQGREWMVRDAIFFVFSK